MFLGNLPRFSLRLDVLRNRKAISLRFKNEALNISEFYCSQLLLLFPNKMLSEQHVVWVLTNERIIDHFWMLVGSLRRVSLRLDVLWKRTAISLRCKNEAFNISERYGSQSLFLFLNSMLSGYQGHIGKIWECCSSRCFSLPMRISIF